MKKKSHYKGILTHSEMQAFKNCRYKWHWRYRERLVPTEKITPLEFGSAVHEGLEFWFRYGKAQDAVTIGVERAKKGGLDLEDQIKVQACLERYFEVYPEEEFEVVDVEKEFVVPLVNPNTLFTSHSFKLSGKVDGLVTIGDEWNKRWYILEHKTAADISEAYKRRILIDTQIAIYATAIGQELFQTIHGAIYDVIKKPAIRMKQGETEEEFEARKAELLKKSKTGKTTAKRQEAETPEAFLQRCREALTSDCFQRFVVELSQKDQLKILDETWKVAQDMMHPTIYRNTDVCTQKGRECPYLELCRANGDLELCPGMFVKRESHEELSSNLKIKYSKQRDIEDFLEDE